LNKLAITVITALGIIFVGQTVYAQSAPPVKPTAPLSAGEVALNKLANAVAQSEGISYSAQITRKITPPTGTPVDKHSSVNVLVERSNKLFVKSPPTGSAQAVALTDGSRALVYDRASAKYAQLKTGPGFSVTISALSSVFSTIFPQMSDNGLSIRIGLDFPFEFLANSPIISTPPPDGTAVYVLTKTVLDGKPVEKISLNFQSKMYHNGSINYYVDAANPDKLMKIERIIDVSGAAPDVMEVTVFTDFKLLKTPAAASEYAFTPPSTATIVAVAPPAAQSAPSETPNGGSTTSAAPPAGTTGGGGSGGTTGTVGGGVPTPTTGSSGGGAPAPSPSPSPAPPSPSPAPSHPLPPPPPI
jgi:hypothetical protein